MVFAIKCFIKTNISQLGSLCTVIFTKHFKNKLEHVARKGAFEYLFYFFKAVHI